MFALHYFVSPSPSSSLENYPLMCSEYHLYLIILWYDNNYVNHWIRLALTFLLSATQNFACSIITFGCFCNVLVGVVSMIGAEAVNHPNINKKELPWAASQLCNYHLQGVLIQWLSSYHQGPGMFVFLLYSSKWLAKCPKVLSLSLLDDCLLQWSSAFPCVRQNCEREIPKDFVKLLF